MGGICLLGLVMAGHVTAAVVATPPAATIPGELVIQETTFQSAGFEWRIDGDANGDATVHVTYRPVGEEAWREAQPLFRVENTDYRNRSNDRIYKEELQQQPFGNKLAGSLFNLQENTAYDARFELSDPDGGAAVRLITVRTRQAQEPPPSARVLHVIPGTGGGKGTPAEPFEGCAAADAAAKPGDVILLHAGVYPPLTPTSDGEPGRPIVWRGVDSTQVIIRGEGPAFAGASSQCAVDLRGRSFVHVESLSIRDSGWGVRLENASDCVVRWCAISRCDIGIGAWATHSRAKRCVISDNTLVGEKQWSMGIERGASRGVLGARGIIVTGDGHVIRHNRIEGFQDGIALGGVDVDAHGIADYAPNTSIDIHHNEIVSCLDTALELDWARSNVRCFDNRITNARNGVSGSPVFGGPLYIVRNAFINTLYSVRLQNEPSGVVLVHNTGFAKSGLQLNGNHLFTRNNVFAAARATVIHGFPVERVDFACNGYLRSGEADHFFVGIEPYGYKTLDDYRINMNQEDRGRMLQLSDFVGARMCDLSYQRPGDLDARPSDHSNVIDAGVTLANLNDGYSGAAPDLGCYEHGSSVPHYGPRTPTTHTPNTGDSP